MFFRWCLPVLALTAFAERSEAQHVPSGQCAVIMASRPNMAAAQEFIASNRGLTVQDIFASTNGWLAISAGFIANADSTRAVAEMAARGQVPPDSYCSTGAVYISRVWTRKQGTSPAVPAAFTTSPWASFDARPLTTAEKRFLQAGLASEGFYSGLLDGVWGNGTQSAFERYSAARTWPDNNASAANLAVDTLERLDAERWHVTWLERFGVSFQIPNAFMRLIDQTSSNVVYETTDQSVLVEVEVVDRQSAIATHDEALRLHSWRDQPYTLRNGNLLVTSVQTGAAKVYVHTRQQTSNTWVSFWVVWPVDDRSGTADLIISSYQTGRGGELDFPKTGHLERLIVALQGEAAAEQKTPLPLPDASVSGPRPVAPAPDSQTPGTGTGFFINPEAYVMTNSHVINGCASLTVDGEPARLVAESESFDLAIIRPISPGKAEQYLSFADRPARLNADVTVAGYPLQQLLSGLNITRGSISAVEGMRGDTTTMQISAPVQPGNSGGPIVNQLGEVVGIVVSKLDAARVAEVTGDIPQNVNFGVRGELGQLFARINRVDLPEVSQSPALAPEDLADKLRAATVLIECR